MQGSQWPLPRRIRETKALAGHRAGKACHRRPPGDGDLYAGSRHGSSPQVSSVNEGAHADRTRVVIECVVGSQTTTVFDEFINVPWRQVQLRGPCTVAITNHGPEVVRVCEPFATGGGHSTYQIVPIGVFDDKLPTALANVRSANPGRVVQRRFSFKLTSSRLYPVAFRVDNLWSALEAFEKRQAHVADMSPNATKDYERRCREIELVCKAQADIYGFPQGDVRPHIPDPPDVLIVPNIRSDQRDGRGVGVEVSELIDEVQHRSYSRARAVACQAVGEWANQGSNAEFPVRLDYGITADLIAGLDAGSKRAWIKDAVHIIDCSVSEFLEPSAPVIVESLRGQGNVLDSRSIPYVWGPQPPTSVVREAIHVRVSASESHRFESHYTNPVSSVEYQAGRLFNGIGGDVTLDERRLQALVDRKANKLQKRRSADVPLASLVLYLTGEYFPARHYETGSLGILRVSDVHPDRSVQYRMGPFSYVYIKHESSYYVIDNVSRCFVELQQRL